MDKRVKNGIHGLKIFLMMMLVLTFGYFLAGEFLLPQYEVNEAGVCQKLQADWVQIRKDGTRIPIQIPTQCRAQRNEPVTIETVLPDQIEDNFYLRFYSLREDLQIYINGVLRQEYSTKDTRLFGKTSSAAYVFVRLTSEDCRGTLTVTLQTDSSYTGVVRDIYMGDRLSLWKKAFRECAAEVVVAFLMLILSGISIIVSVVLRFCYHKTTNLEYLGWGVLIAAVWLLGNSLFRQALFGNISVMSDITFFCIMLLPLPFLLYLNDVQGGRYRKKYEIMGMLAAANLLFCTLCQITGWIDFADSVILMEIICFLTIFFMGATITADIRRGLVKEYQLAAVGLLGAFVSAVAQIVLYLYKIEIPFSGIMIAIGLIFLLTIAFIGTIRDVLRIEQEKKKAVYASESKAQFLANMSHEIRTPIHAVLGMDEMILKECTQENIREYAQDIKNAGKSLLALVNDILDFSKMECGKMEIIPVEYELSSLIHDCCSMVYMRARDKNLSLRIENDKKLPKRLLGDEVRLRQIFVNILTNAVKYTEKGGITVYVNGIVTDEDVLQLKVAIQDTGIGIRQENQSQLFTSFERIEEKKNRNIEGTGLGLSITKQLVDLMQGTISVQSVYGEGSVFIVEIPQKILSKEEVGDLSYKYGIVNEERETESWTAPLGKILVVDDIQMNLKVIKGLLKSTKLQIDTACSGTECLAKVQSESYHIIFLDHMMPEMSGIETLQRMRRLTDSKNRETPVIMLTANAMQGVKEEYLAEGFHDYLAKPIQEEKLKRLILKYLPGDFVQKQQRQQESDDTESAFLKKLSFMDTETGMQYCGGSEVFYREILETYIAGYYEDKIQMFFETKDWKNYCIRVHGIKGASASVGAVQIAEEARKLERAAKQQDDTYIREHHQRFMEQYGMLIRQIEEILDSEQ